MACGTTRTAIGEVSEHPDKAACRQRSPRRRRCGRSERIRRYAFRDRVHDPGDGPEPEGLAMAAPVMADERGEIPPGAERPRPNHLVDRCRRAPEPFPDASRRVVALGDRKALSACE